MTDRDIVKIDTDWTNWDRDISHSKISLSGTVLYNLGATIRCAVTPDGEPL